MNPFWKLCSGEFAGWSSNEYLYNCTGECIGYFHDKIAADRNGRVIGEIYDSDRIGYRTGTSYAAYGAVSLCTRKALTPIANRAGCSVVGWEDPHF